MPIPQHTLSIERPRNSVVICYGKNKDRYAVRERIGCKYINGRRVSANGPIIGHIIDGEYVPNKPIPAVSMCDTGLKDWANTNLPYSEQTNLTENKRQLSQNNMQNDINMQNQHQFSEDEAGNVVLNLSISSLEMLLVKHLEGIKLNFSDDSQSFSLFTSKIRPNSRSNSADDIQYHLPSSGALARVSGAFPAVALRRAVKPLKSFNYPLENILSLASYDQQDLNTLPSETQQKVLIALAELGSLVLLNNLKSNKRKKSNSPYESSFSKERKYIKERKVFKGLEDLEGFNLFTSNYTLNNNKGCKKVEEDNKYLNNLRKTTDKVVFYKGGNSSKGLKNTSQTENFEESQQTEQNHRTPSSNHPTRGARPKNRRSIQHTDDNLPAPQSIPNNAEQGEQQASGVQKSEQNNFDTFEAFASSAFGDSDVFQNQMEGMKMQKEKGDELSYSPLNFEGRWNIDDEEGQENNGNEYDNEYEYDDDNEGDEEQEESRCLNLKPFSTTPTTISAYDNPYRNKPFFSENEMKQMFRDLELCKDSPVKLLYHNFLHGIRDWYWDTHEKKNGEEPEEFEGVTCYIPVDEMKETLKHALVETLEDIQSSFRELENEKIVFNIKEFPDHLDFENLFSWYKEHTKFSGESCCYASFEGFRNVEHADAPEITEPKTLEERRCVNLINLHFLATLDQMPEEELTPFEKAAQSFIKTFCKWKGGEGMYDGYEWTNMNGEVIYQQTEQNILPAYFIGPWIPKLREFGVDYKEFFQVFNTNRPYERGQNMQYNDYIISYEQVNRLNALHDYKSKLTPEIIWSHKTWRSDLIKESGADVYLKSLNASEAKW